MQEIITLTLIQDIVKLAKRFPHLRLASDASDDLTHSEYELLLLLGINLSAEKPVLSVSEISAMLQVTPAGVTHLVNPLEAKGYLQRRASPSDRRVVLIALTEQGQQTANLLQADMQRHLTGLINHLGAEDSQTLFRLIYHALDYFSAQPSKDI
jgi:DNA-binding MarR family transcriptional regulator